MSPSPESPLPIGLQAGGPPCPSTVGTRPQGTPRSPLPVARGAHLVGGRWAAHGRVCRTVPPPPFSLLSPKASSSLTSC